MTLSASKGPVNRTVSPLEELSVAVEYPLAGVKVWLPDVEFAVQLLSELSYGKKVEIQIKGYASPLHEQQYNINLSQRRIMSLINFINTYKSNIFKPYFLSKKFIITVTPFGESQSSEKASDNPNNIKKSIYGIDAMLERKIEIIDVISQ